MCRFVNDFSISDITYYNHYFLNKHYQFNGHNHDCWELNILVQGVLEITYDNIVFTLKRGQAFISEPNVFHRNQVKGNTPIEMIVIHFSTNDLPRMSIPYISDLSENQIDLINYSTKDMDDFLNAHNIQEGDMSLVPCSFKKMIEIFLSKMANNKLSLNPSNTSSTLLYNSAIDFMKASLNRRCTLSDIACACYVSETKLKQVFKQYCGHGPITHYNLIKLDYSKELLDSHHSISDISAQLAYSSPSYFSRVFKKRYGYSPKNYLNK